MSVVFDLVRKRYFLNPRVLARVVAQTEIDIWRAVRSETGCLQIVAQRR